MGNSARRGQLSIDALLCFAALLAAFSLLLLSAGRISSDFRLAVQSGSERQELSYAALCLDTAASAIAGAQFSGRQDFAAAKGGLQAQSRESPGVSEPLFHHISYDSEGRLYVQSDEAEKV